MQAILTWLATYWWLVSLIALALVSVLNAATRHWSTATGFKRVAMFVVELLSYFTSKDAPGWVKLPLTSVPPQGTRSVPGVRPFLWLLLGAGAASLTLGVSACETWRQATKISLDSVGAAATEARPLIERYYAERCEAVARTCAASQDAACAPLVACQAARRTAEAPLVAVHAARVAGYSALAAGDQAGSSSAAAKAAAVLRDALAALHAGGVL
jgi:hypothetical protein